MIIVLLLVDDALRHLSKELKLTGKWNMDKNNLIEYMGLGFIWISFHIIFWFDIKLLLLSIAIVLGYALAKSMYKV